MLVGTVPVRVSFCLTIALPLATFLLSQFALSVSTRLVAHSDLREDLKFHFGAGSCDPQAGLYDQR